jgi:two-component system sensor histidine kinase VicK
MGRSKTQDPNLPSQSSMQLRKRAILNNARSDVRKIKEVEGKNLPSPRRTGVIYGENESLVRSIRFISNSKKLDIFGEMNGPSILIEHSEYRDNLVAARNRGVKVRYLTEIVEQNLPYCKEMIKITDEVRHLEGFTGAIAVSDSEYIATPRLEEKQHLTHLIYSNEEEVVRQQQYFFDALWNKAIPADVRIREIEDGILPYTIETIKEPRRIIQHAYELIRSARDEILIIFHTANAIPRHKKAGGIDLLVESAIKYQTRVKILVPSSDKITDVIGMLKRTKGVEIRNIDAPMQTKMTIIIVDKRYSLVIELKDDTKVNLENAIGLATYSNSQSTVLSYVTIFESLWRQVDLTRELAKSKRDIESSNRRLRTRDKMMEEFVNVAAHELRTPLQPIISFNALARKEQIDKNEALKIIDKHAKKLDKLASDLLAVSRIESGSFHYNFERTAVKTFIADTVNDVIKSNPDLADKRDLLPINMNISEDMTNSYIDVDRQRIAQVLTNVLNNAIKFTEKGNVTVSISRLSYKTANKNSSKSGITSDNKRRLIQIRITDTGAGIPKEILTKLFAKFVTSGIKVGKEFKQGTGLGLFICKVIIKEHGGKIYAYNNENNEGATFVIELPEI